MRRNSVQNTEILNFIKHMRHDFNNCLQIIKGYIEIGCIPDIQIIIDNWVENMNNERIIFTCADAELSLHLYNTKFLVRKFGLNLVYDEINVIDSELLIIRNEPFSSLCLFRENNCVNLEELLVHVKLNETARGINMRFQIENSSPYKEYILKE
ncbi:MAG: Spo0B domain-containing protein [Syntrophomonadaceae bacterium]|nr:Spo0B domain-containing protein [Syntrophomonadaceae bacterium]